MRVPSASEQRGKEGVWVAVLGLILVATVSFLPGGCRAESSDPSAAGTLIRASGEAEVVVAPDRAWVDVAVVSRHAEAAAAVAANAAESERVGEALRAALGRGAQVTTGGYSLAPNYRYVQGQGQVLDGFIVRNRLRVSLEDVGAAGQVIDAASRAGASEIQQVSYGLADEGPVHRQALAEATRNGVERAGVMAAALELTVRRVVSVEDSGAAPAPVIREVRTLAKSAGDSAVPTSLEPGGVHVRASVTVAVEVGP